MKTLKNVLLLIIFLGVLAVAVILLIVKPIQSFMEAGYSFWESVGIWAIIAVVIASLMDSASKFIDWLTKD